MKNILLSVMFAAAEGMSNAPDSLWDRISYSFLVTVLGMVMIFSILAIIMGALYLLEYCFYTLPNKKKNTSAAPVATPAVKTPVAPVAVASADDDEVAAVIAAAIAAYYEQTAPTSKYRIKSFRRI